MLLRFTENELTTLDAVLAQALTGTPLPFDRGEAKSIQERLHQVLDGKLVEPFQDEIHEMRCEIERMRDRLERWEAAFAA